MRSDIPGDYRLVLVIFIRIPVRTVDHDALVQNLFMRHGLTTLLDGLCIVICSCLSATEDHETVFIASGASNSCEPLLRNAEERMATGSCTESVNRNIERAVSAILETNWEGQAGS